MLVADVSHKAEQRLYMGFFAVAGVLVPVGWYRQKRPREAADVLVF
jgi:hypothetical protein